MCKKVCFVAGLALTLVLSGNAFSTIAAPDAGGKLFLGFDGTDVTSADGTLVDSWNDQVAAGGIDNATAGGARRPSLITVNTGNGLHPVIDFNSAQYLKTADFVGGDISQTNVIFIVAAWDTLSSDYLFDGISSSERHALYTRSNNTYGMYAGAQIINGNVPAVTGEFQVFAASFTGGGNGWLRINGTQVLNGNVGNDVLGGLSIGSNYGASGFLDGKVAEVLVYNGGLNTAQLLSIEDYLQNKYIVPEPATMALLAMGGFCLLRRKYS